MGEKESEITTSMIEIENQQCNVLVWARLPHSHGIRFYYFPCVFVRFSILRLQQLVVGEKERERTTGVMS